MAQNVPIPTEFSGGRRKLSLPQARGIVGRWLAFTRALDPGRKALVLANRPELVATAYKVSNSNREISKATRKAMGKAGNAVPHTRRSIASRLKPLLDRKLPNHARIILRQVKPAGRPAFNTAILEIPFQDHPNFVQRFRASFSSAHSSIACTTRGHAKHPQNAPKTHPWRKISPKALPSLHPIAQAFISALQTPAKPST